MVVTTIRMFQNPRFWEIARKCPSLINLSHEATKRRPLLLLFFNYLTNQQINIIALRYYIVQVIPRPLDVTHFHGQLRVTTYDGYRIDNFSQVFMANFIHSWICPFIYLIPYLTFFVIIVKKSSPFCTYATIKAVSYWNLNHTRFAFLPKAIRCEPVMRGKVTFRMRGAKRKRLHRTR